MQRARDDKAIRRNKSAAASASASASAAAAEPTAELAGSDVEEEQRDGDPLS
jgi:hypothetical protein